MYRRILGPLYDKEIECWGILTNREIYTMVNKLTIAETIRLNRLCWFGHVQRMEGNRVLPPKILSMNLEGKSLTGRKRNRWQDEVRKDGRLVGGIGCRERIDNREEWKKLLRTAMNRHILHMTTDEWKNKFYMYMCVRLSDVKVVLRNHHVKKFHFFELQNFEILVDF